MLQDRLGLSPVLQHSPMYAQNIERIESLLRPFLAAHPAEYSDWLLPAHYAFVPLPSKVKRTFLLCSKRAESPVSRLSIELVKRIFTFAQYHLFIQRESRTSADRAAERLDDFCKKHELSEYCEAMNRAGYRFVGDLYAADADDMAAGQPLPLILDSMKKPERKRFTRLVRGAIGSLGMYSVTYFQPVGGANLPNPAVD
jgi:hypothetical protein